MQIFLYVATHFFRGELTYVVNQRVDGYITSVNSRRWTAKMRSYVLDVTRVYAQSLYSLNNDINPWTKKIKGESFSFAFGWDLGITLVIPWMRVRAHMVPRH